MSTVSARLNVMPGKDDDSVSPYLRKPARTYEDVTREQANRPQPPNPKKGSSDPGDPGKAKHSPKPGDPK